MIGHCLGAAGGLEAIATVKAITTGWLHPSINQFVCVRSFVSFDSLNQWFFKSIFLNQLFFYFLLQSPFKKSKANQLDHLVNCMLDVFFSVSVES